MQTIYLPEAQPAPVKKTTGEWINIELMFQKEKGGKTEKAQLGFNVKWEKFADAALETVLRCIGKEMHVDSLEYREQVHKYSIRLPKSQPVAELPLAPAQSTTSAATGGTSRVQMGVEEYIALANTFFTSFVKMQECLGNPSEDRKFETAQQLTIQAIITVQNGMIQLRSEENI
jgi:hypothetical protein